MGKVLEPLGTFFANEPFGDALCAEVKKYGFVYKFLSNVPWTSLDQNLQNLALFGLRLHTSKGGLDITTMYVVVTCHKKDAQWHVHLWTLYKPKFGKFQGLESFLLRHCTRI